MQDIPLTDIDIAHHVQRKILLQLRQQGKQTYQRLKPDGLEGNAYNYHLKNLKKSGLIRLTARHYELTETGDMVTDAFSFSNERLVFRPHVYTYLLVTQGSKMLLYEPTRRPLPGRLSLPSGKLHYGDSFAASISRELKRRNIQQDYSFQQLCSINVRYHRDGVTVMHRPGLIWHIDYAGNLSTSTTPSGMSQWYHAANIAENKRVLPEVTQALTRLSGTSSEAIDLQIEL